MEKINNALRQRREQIDSLDSRLLRLLNRRAQVAAQVASIKISSGLPVYDKQREQAILDRVCHQNQGPLDSQGLAAIFRCIIRESRKVEEASMRQGRQHSFSQENGNGD